MRRRAIIALLGFAAVFGAAAQAPPPVIGFLSSRSSAESAALVSAFREGLRESGFADGQNVRIEFRWADGDYARLASLASDLVSKRVALLVPVGGEVAALAAKSAAPDIPVVFVIGSDPVEAGLVAMLGRPGGNVTGATLMAGALGAKRLEMLR
jgi:putative tryptophan/tyrosine transport system substrate-binding protein